MVRVNEGKKRRNGNGLDSLLTQSSYCSTSGFLVERRFDGPVRPKPFRNRQPSAPRNDREGRLESHVPDVFLVATSQLEFVAKAFRGQKPRDCAIHFDEGIVGDRRAVDDCIHAPEKCAQFFAAAGGQFFETLENSQRSVGGRTQNLFENPFSIANQGEIRERSADVDPDTQAHDETAFFEVSCPLRCRVASRSTSRSSASSEPRKTTPYRSCATSMLTYSSSTSSRT